MGPPRLCLMAITVGHVVARRAMEMAITYLWHRDGCCQVLHITVLPVVC